MPGLKIIEVVLGLTFVYLLLSLLCTAINEYIAGMLNKRGKHLFKAVDDLLGSEEVQEAFYRHPLITTLSPHHHEIRRRVKEIEDKLYGTRWARRFLGWLRPTIRSHRYPSYLPARNFALALLNSTDYTAQMQGAAASPPAGPTASPPGGGEVVATPLEMARLFDALLQESSADVSELLRDPAVARILGSRAVPPAVRDALTDVATGTEREVQKLQDAVELWFNNAMDRVSGTYKRYTQIALLLIGLVVAILLNVDTLSIWRTLSTNDELREAVVRQAIAFDAAHSSSASAGDSQDGSGAAPGTAADTTAVDTTATDTTATDATATDTTATDTTTGAPATNPESPTDTTASGSDDCAIPTGAAAEAAYKKAIEGQKLTCGEARAVIAMARAQLDSTQLAVGWTRAELLELGVARVDTIPPDTAQQRAATADAGKTAVQTRLVPVLWPFSWHRAILPKLLGLLITAIAVSLGAPFWFDMLNKIINIRSAGRAPDERPKNPEAAGKRLGEVAPR